MRTLRLGLALCFVSLFAPGCVTSGGASNPDGGGAAGGGGAGGQAGQGGAAADAASDVVEAPANPHGSMGAGGPTGFQDGQTLDVGGVKRKYVLDVPATYDGRKPMPLVVFLHGSGQAFAAGELAYEVKGMKLAPTAEKNGFILVAPEGCVTSGGQAWCPKGGMDDNAYLDALIADLENRYNVDTKKIYVMGFSAGGFMSGIYGFPRSDKITALGIFGAAFAMGSDPTLATRKLPIFIRVLKGDPSESLAASGVEKLKSLGWAESDIDAEIGQDTGGHIFDTIWDQPMWDFFAGFETP